MRKHFFKFASLMAASCLATAGATMLRPRISVDFQQPVNVGTEIIPAGHYLFQQIDTWGNSPVFQVQKPDGDNVAITAVARSTRVPISTSTYTPPAAKHTDIVLEKVDGKYYLDKIWIQGRSHGWAFDIPDQAILQARQMRQRAAECSCQKAASRAS